MRPGFIVRQSIPLMHVEQMIGDTHPTASPPQLQLETNILGRKPYCRHYVISPAGEQLIQWSSHPPLARVIFHDSF